MLETLSKGFKNARLKLQGKTQLSEDNIKNALRDVRVSLLGPTSSCRWSGAS